MDDWWPVPRPPGPPEPIVTLAWLHAELAWRFEMLLELLSGNI